MNFVTLAGCEEEHKCTFGKASPIFCCKDDFKVWEFFFRENKVNTCQKLMAFENKKSRKTISSPLLTC